MFRYSGEKIPMSDSDRGETTFNNR